MWRDITSCLRFCRSASSSTHKQRCVSSSMPSTTGMEALGRAPWLYSCLASFNTCATCVNNDEFGSEVEQHLFKLQLAAARLEPAPGGKARWGGGR